MFAWTPAEVGGVAALVLAVVQWWAAPWRDLGVLTLAACGGAVVLGRGAPGPTVAALVLVALLIAAWAWNRGSRRGVGRPGLDGLAFSLSFIAVLLPFAVPRYVPPGPREHLVELILVSLGLVAAVGLPLALERPGPRRRRPRFFRRVPVVEQPPDARGDPPTTPDVEGSAPGPSTPPQPAPPP